MKIVFSRSKFSQLYIKLIFSRFFTIFEFRILFFSDKSFVIEKYAKENPYLPICYTEKSFKMRSKN